MRAGGAGPVPRRADRQDPLGRRLAVPADQIKARLRKDCKGGRPPGLDCEAYKQRNTVERAINKLRQHRAVTTRYDKRDFAYRGTVDAAASRIWLRDPSQDLRGTRPSAGKARGAWVKYRVKVTGCLLEGT